MVLKYCCLLVLSFLSYTLPIKWMWNVMKRGGVLVRGAIKYECVKGFEKVE